MFGYIVHRVLVLVLFRIHSHEQESENEREETQICEWSIDIILYKKAE
jgi:hypothetical protein